ncbi:putative porin [Membranihabitans marinus]|uniref:putative porin n=1 Tax=Membranihabitans marinus TaxID=1227546 RepID=UPI001F226440|nr:putative porin [Membranihabitans marinus]
MSIQVWAQSEEGGRSEHSHPVVNDTIQYSNYQYKSMVDNVTDTMLNGNFNHIDAVEKKWPYESQLGYSGSPRNGVYTTLPRDASWSLGFNAFDVYRKNFSDLLFIQEGLPITKATYVQTPQVNQSIFNGFFARKFNNLSFSIDHQRYNFTGDYDNQQSYNTIFHTGAIYREGKWSAHFLFASEVFQQSNNGGIITDSLYASPDYSNRISITTVLEDGRTRDDTKKGSLGLLYNALSIDNYIGSIGGGIDISQRVVTMSSGPPNDSTYYLAYQEDDTGINSFIEKNSFFPHAIIELSDTSKSRFTLESKTGIGIHQVQYGERTDPWQAFVQKAKLNFNSNYFTLLSNLDLQIFNDNLYFTIDGELAGHWKGFEVRGFGQINRTISPWIFHRYDISGQLIWDGQPQSQFSQILGGQISYHRPNLKADLRVEQIFQDNLPYFNTQGLPDQLNNQISIIASPSLSVKLGLFHLKNKISYQHFDNNILGIPELSGRHEIFIEDHWFKRNMHINLGFIAYWKTQHDASYYLPYVQSFIPTGETLPSDYRIDPFFAFRVKTFKLFVRGENMQLLWDGDTPTYDIYHYPLLDPTIRLGIEWIFRD